GSDIVIAGAGDDFLYGREDRDILLAGSGSDHILDINDVADDINVLESNALDFDQPNPAYNLANTATFLSPNDSALIGLLATWNGAGAFAVRTTAVQSALPVTTNDGSFDFLTGNIASPDYNITGFLGRYDSLDQDITDTLP